MTTNLFIGLGLKKHGSGLYPEDFGLPAKYNECDEDVCLTVKNPTQQRWTDAYRTVISGNTLGYSDG